MAVYEQLEQEHTSNPSTFLLDELYCEEEDKWEEEDEEEEEEDDVEGVGGCVEDHHLVIKHSNPCLIPKAQTSKSSVLPLVLLEQDLCWEDEELHSLFSKEQQQKLQNPNLDYTNSSSAICLARKDAVEWMLKVNAHYGFSPLTAILSINYLDRFLSSLDRFKQIECTGNNKKPWMIQLAAVTCLSLAAKVEETHAPLLLDLQVEGTKYLFEAKTIQKMEIVVLSTLGWRMNPVTPISFFDHIIRRLGLKAHIHWEFLRRFERLLLSAVADSRFVSYLPSVLAAATVMHVIDQIETSNPLLVHQNQLLAVLNMSKDKVEDCYNHIVEISSIPNTFSNYNKKRKTEDMIVPRSPSGVMDAYYVSSESSNDTWPSPLLKKSRVHEQQMRLPPSLSRVCADIVGSPR